MNVLSKEILIQIEKEERLVAIIENGKVDDFHIEVDRYQSLLGNIYKGKVESILPSINAAFVNIGQERNGFLYLTDAVSPRVKDIEFEPRSFFDKIFSKSNKEEAPPKPPPRKNKTKKDEIPFKIGQEILVQVVKDPFGEKGARLTTHVTLPGRFVVFMPFDRQTGVSKKIDRVEERKRLREIIKEFNFVKSGGFIIRTASHQASKREIIRDAKFLYKAWTDINRKAEKEKAPAIIYEEGQLTWKIVRDYFTDKIDKLIIDDKDEYDRIRRFVQTLIGRSMVNKIHHYRGHAPLFESKQIAKDLKSIYDKNVYCKSGAYVVIEQTEAVIVIDVNSGKFKTKASPGEAAFMVNMEVIPEIARQLRLRDLGGIIVIDFIDMTTEAHKRKVIDALQKNLSKDHAKTEVYKISPLGLVEMTRARTGKTIQSLSFGKCPYCAGRGHVKIA